MVLQLTENGAKILKKDENCNFSATKNSFLSGKGGVTATFCHAMVALQLQNFGYRQSEKDLADRRFIRQQGLFGLCQVNSIVMGLHSVGCYVISTIYLVITFTARLPFFTMLMPRCGALTR